jgi:hypothetical protein
LDARTLPSAARYVSNICPRCTSATACARPATDPVLSGVPPLLIRYVHMAVPRSRAFRLCIKTPTI